MLRAGTVSAMSIFLPTVERPSIIEHERQNEIDHDEDSLFAFGSRRNDRSSNDSARLCTPLFQHHLQYYSPPTRDVEQQTPTRAVEQHYSPPTRDVKQQTPTRAPVEQHYSPPTRDVEQQTPTRDVEQHYSPPTRG